MVPLRRDHVNRPLRATDAIRVRLLTTTPGTHASGAIAADPTGRADSKEEEVALQCAIRQVIFKADTGSIEIEFCPRTKQP